jgi:hypothetical protein
MPRTAEGRLLIRKVQVRVLPGAPNHQVRALLRLPCLLRGHAHLPAPDPSAAADNGSGRRVIAARVCELVAHERATGTRLAAREAAAAGGISERRAYELLRAVRAE